MRPVSNQLGCGACWASAVGFSLRFKTFGSQVWGLGEHCARVSKRAFLHITSVRWFRNGRVGTGWWQCILRWEKDLSHKTIRGFGFAVFVSRQQITTQDNLHKVNGSYPRTQWPAHRWSPEEAKKQESKTAKKKDRTKKESKKTTK